MSQRITSAQAPFKILVANLTGGSDPSRGTAGNPVKARRSFTLQHFVDVPGRGPEIVPASSRVPGTSVRMGHVAYTVADTPVRATGTITVANNAFTGPTTVHVGPYVLTSGDDFAIGGNAAATAANLQAAIDLLPDYDAAIVGAVVTVTGFAGPLGNEAIFRAGGSSPNNLTFSPTTGRMSGAEPRLGPPLID